MVCKWTLETHTLMREELDMKVLEETRMPSVLRAERQGEKINSIAKGEGVECQVDVVGDVNWKIDINDTVVGGSKRMTDGEMLCIKVIIRKAVQSLETQEEREEEGVLDQLQENTGGRSQENKKKERDNKQQQTLQTMAGKELHIVGTNEQ